MTRYITLLFAAVLTVLSAFAQTNKTHKEVKVISKFKSQLPTGEKINKTPVLIDTTRTKVKFSYLLNPRPVNSEFDLFSDEAPRIKGEPLKDFDGGYFKLGAGNYSTWFGEFGYNNKRSRLWNWGVFLNHGSSNGKVDVGGSKKHKTGFGNTDFNFYAKRFMDKAVASVSLSYNMDKLRYYGANEYSRIYGKEQKFTDFGVKFLFESTMRSDIKYKARLSYNKFMDDFSKWDENFFVAGFNAETKILGNMLNVDIKAEHLAQGEYSTKLKNSSGGFGAGNYYYKYDFDDYTTFHLNPKYNINSGALMVNLGFGSVYRVGFDSKLFIYPDLDVKFSILDDVLAFYAFAKGDVYKNTFRNLSKENPFVLVSANFFRRDFYGNIVGSYHAHTKENVVQYTKYNIGGGFKGQFSRFVFYNISASYKYVKDFTAFNNEFHDYDGYEKNNSVGFENYFMPRYHDGKILNIKAELCADIDDNLRISSVLNYYKYSMDNDQKPRYKPESELDIRADYKFDSKLKFGAELKYVGDRFTHTEYFSISGSSGIGYLQWKDIFDSYTLVNLDAEYEITDYVHAFAKINNLFNKKYEMWKNYPNYRFNLLLGATFTF